MSRADTLERLIESLSITRSDETTGADSNVFIRRWDDAPKPVEENLERLFRDG